MGWQAEVLDLIAQLKAEAGKPKHPHFDRLAVEIISQDHAPLKMADNLNHWLELTKDLTLNQFNQTATISLDSAAFNALANLQRHGLERLRQEENGRA